MADLEKKIEKFKNYLESIKDIDKKLNRNMKDDYQIESYLL